MKQYLRAHREDAELTAFRTIRPVVFPIAATPIAQKYFSINLDTCVPEEQRQLPVSPLQARLPLRSSRAVSLSVKFRIERQEGSTSSARFSPLARGLTFCPMYCP